VDECESWGVRARQWICANFSFPLGRSPPFMHGTFLVISNGLKPTVFHELKRIDHMSID
jgi:hypothetical protein